MELFPGKETLHETAARDGRALIPMILGRSLRGDGAALRRAAIAGLAPGPRDTVLELGCGDGRLLLELATRSPLGLVVGVEPDPWMVRHARARTRRFVDQGRVRVLEGSSADLSALPDAAVDRAAAVDVIYFWQQPERDLAEIRRVLRPGGLLLLGYAADPATPPAVGADLVRPAETVERWLRGAGFADVRSGPRREEPGCGLTWSRGVRPARAARPASAPAPRLAGPDRSPTGPAPRRTVQ